MCKAESQRLRWTGHYVYERKAQRILQIVAKQKPNMTRAIMARILDNDRRVEFKIIRSDIMKAEQWVLIASVKSIKKNNFI